MPFSIKSTALTLALMAAGFCQCTFAADKADAIYINGRVWTDARDGSFAQAIAVRGENILAVDSNARVRALADEKTRVVDLGGKLVTPGFIDNHTHFVDASLSLTDVDLRDAATPEEFSRRIAARAKAQPGEWILHGNWDHELWGTQLPERTWIDAQTGDTPVFVVRLDGHMGLANSAALKLAGIDEKSTDPVGGEIIRDAQGKPTGLLKDTAMDAVYRIIPAATTQRIDAALQSGFQEALSHGVTQIHDMSDGNWVALESFRRVHAAGKLGTRVYSFVPIADWAKLAQFVKANGRGDEWLRWGGVKGFIDGSLGSTTAWFYEPFTDAPSTSGLTMVDPKDLAERIEGADRAGLHIAIHAIGDRANDWVLDEFARVMKLDSPRDRRFRVEHAQHVRLDAFARYKALNVIASMQPYHAIDDGRWAEKRIGKERLKGTYAFRSFLDAGVVLTFGSDWAVAPLDPIAGIDAAVNRRTIDGKHPNGWQPRQRISVVQAVRAYTSSNAYAGFQEQRVGALEPGYLADFVVLSDDLFGTDPKQIPKVKVLRTVIGGEDRYIAGSEGS
jgi:predicted amidohydrolase YtcJ